MIIQDRDGSLVQEPECMELLIAQRQSYRADVPAYALDEHGTLIDRIISFAFDTLGATRVELRVRERE